MDLDRSCEGEDGVMLSFLVTPLVAWIWIGGAIAAAGTLLTLAPTGRRRSRHAMPSGVLPNGVLSPASGPSLG